MVNLAVFCSGFGSNLQAIIDAIRSKKLKVRIALVIADVPHAYALKRAQKAKIPTVIIRPKAGEKRIDYDKRIIEQLKKYKVDYIILAGFMRLLSKYFVRSYKNKILNIHPALLPSFKGTHGVRDALHYGVKIAGPTVHFVDEGLDSGAIILQSALKVRDGDSEESLTRRIHKEEHKIYPRAIRLVIEGKLEIKGRRVINKK